VGWSSPTEEEYDLDFRGELEEPPSRPPRAVRDESFDRDRRRTVARRRALALAVACGLVLLVVVVVLLSGQGASANGATRSYMLRVNDLGVRSQRSVPQLVPLLLAEAHSGAELARTLSASAAQQRNLVPVAVSLRPPARLEAVQGALLDVLQLRARGLDDLGRLLGSVGQDAGALRARAASAVQRLLAADVMWRDLVRAPLQRESERRGVADAAVVDSRVLTDERLLAGKALRVALMRAGGLSARAGTLRPGAHGTAVSEWQTELNSWLAAAKRSGQPLAVDGGYGSATASATRDFQRARGLPPSGVADQATQQALTHVLAPLGSRAR
jgi:hypothetical protein